MNEAKVKIPEDVELIIETVKHMARNTVAFNESDNVHELKKGMDIFGHILGPILRERFEKTDKIIKNQEKELAKWRI